MGVSEKLYPPTIGETLPAFYSEEIEVDGAVTKSATITVPFAMNKAVNINQISGFILKLKTVQNNISLGTIEYKPIFQNEEGQLTIEEQLKNIVDQGIIYFNLTNNNIFEKIKVGQFLKAQIAYIDKMTDIIGYYSTVGIIKYTSNPNLNFDLSLLSSLNDFLKKTYTYSTVDKTEQLYQHKFSLFKKNEDDKTIFIKSSGWLNVNNDYSFHYSAEPGISYFIECSIKTINNLEKTIVQEYREVEDLTEQQSLSLKLKNNFEEGYIDITIHNESNITKIEICRQSQTSQDQWYIIKELKNAQNGLNFRDYAIEQGIMYTYSIKYYSDNKSQRMDGQSIIADYEDMFLYDGEKQIKLRFNPRISSFKTTRLESKTDTIGNRFPFFFRNGEVNYKEFPISGLISYHLDDNKEFIKNPYTELGIIYGKELERLGNSKKLKETINNQIQNLSTTDLTKYNIKAERQFKLKLMEWLGNGQPKIFKSPAEGNYIVRLLNVSLSPEDKLNRMLHSFSCTAYEVAEYNYDNLFNLIEKGD